MTAAIQMDRLSKYYGRSRGIEDVSLRVEEGDFFGFIGPNGAGKSTTIRILLNLIFPSSGHASIFGLDAVKDSRKIRQNLGYIPSEASLYDKMKVMEFLRFMASFYGRDIHDGRIRELANMLDLDPDRKMHELSTGNKKKVSIIQGLAHRPRLLILDEPTTGLDPLIQSRLFTLLTEENRRGTTIFFSSHVLSDVQNLCRKVAIVREGKIIRSGSLSDLRERHLKKISLMTADGFSADKLKLPGIEQFSSDGTGRCIFLFSGPVKDLLAKLSEMEIKDLNVEDLPLEEIFLHYYTTENQET